MGRQGSNPPYAGAAAVAWLIAMGFLLGGRIGLGLIGLGLALAVILAVILLGPLASIEVERVLPEAPLRAGDQVTVGLRVSSRWPWPWFLLRVEDNPPSGLVADTEAGGSASLVLSHTATLEYRLSGVPRGLHAFTDIRVTALDPFGLVQRTWRLTRPDELLVWPRPLWPKDPSSVLSGDRTLGYALSDLRSARPYQPGDSPASIDWRSTAKTGQLLVREYDRAGQKLPITLGTKSGGGQELEQTLSEAAGLIEWAVRQGWAVGLIVPDIPDASVPPGTGQRHYEKLMRTLALYTGVGAEAMV